MLLNKFLILQKKTLRFNHSRENASSSHSSMVNEKLTKDYVMISAICEGFLHNEITNKLTNQREKDFIRKIKIKLCLE